MKKLTINIEEAPRELATEKSVCDIVADYTELSERVNFEIVHEDGTIKKFSLEDFNNENDGLTRKEFIAKVLELQVVKCVVNTGREIAYLDEKDGKNKTKVEKLPKYTNVKMLIK